MSTFRATRADATANRERLLDTAASVFRTRGTAVPMAELAGLAGVGVGTLYRHFPDREALLAALELRSYERTLELARDAAAAPGSGIAALRRYLAGIIAARDGLLLPLHGGPMSEGEPAAGLRRAIGAAIETLLARGRRDGTVRADAEVMDVVIGGTFLCVPLPRAVDWDPIAARQLDIFIAGMSPASGPDDAGRPEFNRS